MALMNPRSKSNACDGSPATATVELLCDENAEAPTAQGQQSDDDSCHWDISVNTKLACPETPPEPPSCEFTVGNRVHNELIYPFFVSTRFPEKVFICLQKNIKNVKMVKNG